MGRRSQAVPGRRAGSRHALETCPWWRKPAIGVWVVTGVLTPLVVSALNPAATVAVASVWRSLLTAIGVRHDQVPLSWVVTRSGNSDNECESWLFPGPVSKIPVRNFQGARDPAADERWALRNGAADINGGAYTVALQGSTVEDVVIRDVRVKILWRSHVRRGTEIDSGGGCGGGLTPQDFAVSLDSPQVPLIPRNNATKWPYVISSRLAPEYLVLDASLGSMAGGDEYHFVYEVDWSQGSRSGTATAYSPDGRPFTAVPAIPGAPEYHSLNGKWVITVSNMPRMKARE